MYYRVPLDDDLSKTSYRASVYTDNAQYIEYNEGHIGNNWEKVSEGKLIELFGYNPFEEKPEPQPYQPSNAEVAQMISDLQVDLILAGVI